MLHRNEAPSPATRFVPYAECLEHSMFLTREQHAWITCYPVVPFLRNRPLLVTSPTKLKKQTSTKSKMFSVAHIQIWMGSDDGITSSKSQRLLRQIPLATDKLLSQHPPPSGELKNVETNPNSQAVIVTCLPLDLDGKSRLYQVALSANATIRRFLQSDGLLPHTRYTNASVQQRPHVTASLHRKQIRANYSANRY